MTKTKTEMLHTDTEAVKRTEQGIEQFTKMINEFKAKYDSLHPGVIKTTEDLQEALFIPKQFFESHIYNLIPDSEHGLPVNKQERIKALIFPDFSEVIGISNTIRTTVRQYGLDSVERIYKIENNIVTVDSELLSDYLSKHSIKASEANADKIEFIRLHKELAKSFEAFRDFCNSTFGVHNLRNTFEFYNSMSGFDLNNLLTETGKGVDINPQLYKRLFDNYYKK